MNKVITNLNALRPDATAEEKAQGIKVYVPRNFTPHESHAMGKWEEATVTQSTTWHGEQRTCTHCQSVQSRTKSASMADERLMYPCIPAEEKA